MSGKHYSVEETDKLKRQEQQSDSFSVHLHVHHYPESQELDHETIYRHSHPDQYHYNISPMLVTFGLIFFFIIIFMVCGQVLLW